jgi:sugar phosphate isomerase/epimerase
MNRRQFAISAGAAALSRVAAAPATERTTMGVAATCYMTFARPKDTLAFLEHCAALGAGGVQMSLSSLEPESIARLRARARELGMYVEAMGALPRTADTALLERTLAAARDAGALCLRVACLSGRRYETFADLASWRRFVDDGLAALDRALPIAEKHGVALALENHKDWTARELAAIVRERKHPLLGVCLDTGNNISLLDDPMEAVETLAPYAVSTHIKDMAVESWRDGFLLAEVPLGSGMLDLKKVVGIIRSARPRARFTLEMITRNPLEVPCLTEKYWATFPERGGRELARALRMARDRGARRPLPRVDGMTSAAQAQLEEENVRACLRYARAELGLA